MYNSAEEMVKDEQREKGNETVKLATVTELFSDGCAKVQFYGEDVASEKKYSYISTYIPTVNDIVVMLRTNNSYVIIGNIRYDVAPNEEFNIEEYLTDNGYIKKESDGTIVITDTATSNVLSKINGIDLLYTNVVGTLVKATGTLRHTGNYIGFFGTTPIAKRNNVNLSTNTDLAHVISKVNELLGDLRAYGLIG